MHEKRRYSEREVLHSDIERGQMARYEGLDHSVYLSKRRVDGQLSAFHRLIDGRINDGQWSYLQKEYGAFAVPVLWLLQGYYKENLF